MDGIVTRRNIEEGETAVVGTMNNAGTVLLTIADMSVLEAEVEVDETDIPNVALGQQAKVTIDAVPDREFKGHVTEIGNSPIQTSTSSTRAAPGHHLQGRGDASTSRCPTCRPGFTCTAEITTATRQERRVGADPGAHRPRHCSTDARAARARAAAAPQQRSADDARRRHGSRPPEGTRARKPKACSCARTARPCSRRSRSGIAGEQYFEVTDGLKAGDQVITGPFASVRGAGRRQDVRLQQNNSPALGASATPREQRAAGTHEPDPRVGLHRAPAPSGRTSCARS